VHWVGIMKRQKGREGIGRDKGISGGPEEKRREEGACLVVLRSGT